MRRIPQTNKIHKLLPGEEEEEREREFIQAGSLRPSSVRHGYLVTMNLKNIQFDKTVIRSPGGIAENLIFDWACKEGVEWMDGGTMEGGAGHAWRKLLNESACRNGRRRSQFVAGGRDGESGRE